MEHTIRDLRPALWHTLQILCGILSGMRKLSSQYNTQDLYVYCVHATQYDTQYICMTHNLRVLRRTLWHTMYVSWDTHMPHSMAHSILNTRMPRSMPHNIHVWHTIYMYDTWYHRHAHATPYRTQSHTYIVMAHMFCRTVSHTIAHILWSHLYIYTFIHLYIYTFIHAHIYIAIAHISHTIVCHTVSHTIYVSSDTHMPRSMAHSIYTTAILRGMCVSYTLCAILCCGIVPCGVASLCLTTSILWGRVRTQ